MSAPRGTAVRPLMVDLFSGTGGASAAAAARGWRVVRVELQPLEGAPAGTVRADVRALPLPRLLAPDLLWASPPCTEFSGADARVDHSSKVPSLELVAATLRAVAELRPRWWVLENVRGAIPFLGIPAAKVGPFCLWGYFPPLRVRFAAQVHQKRGRRDAAARAAIPYALSEALVEAVERHQGVRSLLDLRPFRKHRHRAARAAAAASSAELPL